jgi:release factor glutamine methyltransferase
MIGIYDDREASIIARYLLEDLYRLPFWSEEEMSLNQQDLLNQSIERLKNFEPWQYIGGQADFYGYKFHVDKNVLIPRPETEELVHIALKMIKEYGLKSALDIGTGSGIIPISIALKTDIQNIFGVDISEAALEISRKNNQLHQKNVGFFKFDIKNESLWSKLPKVDFVISNPPYIDTTESVEMHKNVLDHEPHIALFVSQDIMEFYTAIAKFVANHQESSCCVLVEINEKHGPKVFDVFIEHDLVNVQIIKDLQGKDRMVMAMKN